MRRVLVTGANRGLGLEMVRGFLVRGDFVLATARHPHQAGELLALREGEHAERLKILSLDLASEESVFALAAELQTFPGAIDILMNNAGVFPEEGDEKFEDFSLDHLEEAFRVNVLGTIRLTQRLLSLLRKGREARIINLSSGAASLSTKDHHRQYAYGLSKAALNHFSRGLAAELRGEGIIVVPLSPGWVRTGMGGSRAELEAGDAAESVVETVGRLTLGDSGEFLDRKGRTGVYAW